MLYIEIKKEAKMVTTQDTVENKGVKYTFCGEYYSKDKEGLTLKNYEISIVFPELLQAPLSVFKKGALTPNHPIHSLIIKKYPDYESVRTYSVLSVANYSGQTLKKVNDINIMNIEQLKEYINENDIKIDTAVYNDDVNKVRAAIVLAQDDPEKFETQYQEDVKEYEYNKQLSELNAVQTTSKQEDKTETKQSNNKKSNKQKEENQLTNNQEKGIEAKSENDKQGENIDDLLGDLDNGDNLTGNDK